MIDHPNPSSVIELNEQILLFRVRNFRDQQAFTRLVNEHKKELYRFVRSKLPTAEDTDDLLQTVLMRVWVYITTAHAKETHHFRGLLYHVARNAIADHYRSRKDASSIEALEEDGVEIAGTRQGGAEMIATADVSVIKERMARLKPEYRDVLMMKYFEGMDVSDIALRLEKTENNVRVLVHRARKELQKLL